MELLRAFWNDEGGIELIEFVVGGTISLAIMTLMILALWGTTHGKAAVTNNIISSNVPSAPSQ